VRGLPSRAKTKCSAYTQITGVTHDKGFISTWILMINCCQALGAYNQYFYGFESFLMCLSPCGRKLCSLFVVSGIRMQVWLVRLGRNIDTYQTRPRNPQISVALFGTGQFRTLSIFEQFALKSLVWYCVGKCDVPRSQLLLEKIYIYSGYNTVMPFTVISWQCYIPEIWTEIIIFFGTLNQSMTCYDSII